LISSASAFMDSAVISRPSPLASEASASSSIAMTSSRRRSRFLPQGQRLLNSPAPRAQTGRSRWPSDTMCGALIRRQVDMQSRDLGENGSTLMDFDLRDATPIRRSFPHAREQQRSQAIRLCETPKECGPTRGSLPEPHTIAGPSCRSRWIEKSSSFADDHRADTLQRRCEWTDRPRDSRPESATCSASWPRDAMCRASAGGSWASTIKAQSCAPKDGMIVLPRGELQGQP
jgi:hypothetical protein